MSRWASRSRSPQGKGAGRRGERGDSNGSAVDNWFAATGGNDSAPSSSGPERGVFPFPSPSSALERWRQDQRGGDGRSSAPRSSLGDSGGCGGGRQFDAQFERNCGVTGPSDETWEPEERVGPIIEEFVPVPKALIRKVIGKGAQTIKGIREKSGCIKLDARDQDDDPCLVKVVGTAEAVARAHALIVEVLDSTNIRRPGTSYIEIPRGQIGMVIGIKGADVIAIQHKTGTRIDVDFNLDPCRVYIQGPDDAVAAATKILKTIAMQIEDENSEYLDLPKAASGALIGRGGCHIREFQQASGARIDVDKTGEFCRVRLSGTPEQIDIAKAMILDNTPKRVPPRFEGVQPTSSPESLADSIARARAAAEAVKEWTSHHNHREVFDAFSEPPQSHHQVFDAFS